MTLFFCLKTLYAVVLFVTERAFNLCLQNSEPLLSLSAASRPAQCSTDHHQIIGKPNKVSAGACALDVSRIRHCSGCHCGCDMRRVLDAEQCLVRKYERAAYEIPG